MCVCVAYLRHSNVSSADDAGSCVREAAIKFADQNVDAPLDLILLTGRKALARHANSLIKVLKLKTPDDVIALCQSDPLLYVRSLPYAIKVKVRRTEALCIKVTSEGPTKVRTETGPWSPQKNN